jgi:hypothetical protein
MKKNHLHRSVRPHVIAAAAALLCSSTWATITPTGNTNAWPGNPAIGPGDTDLGNVGLFVGNDGTGTLTADGGSFLRTGALLIGPSGSGSGNGTVLFTGAGTRIELVGDGFSDGVINRLGVGEWGRGVLTVADGAVLDGRAAAAACVGVNHFCNNFIGNAAGSDGTFTVTGAGSQASFLRGFLVGGLAVFRPPIDSFTFGTPGGTTQGRVNVLDGGRLTTEGASMGLAPGGSSPLGTERSFADVVIRGAGSTWVVTEGVLEARDAFFNMANHRNAWATTTIDQGGRLELQGSDTRFSGVTVGNNGGRADMAVRGVGSVVTFTQRNGTVQVGRRSGSVGQLDITAGGTITNAFYSSVGRDGGFGTLNVDGAGSVLLLNQTTTAAANGVSGAAAMDIGRNGGTGVVNVTNGSDIAIFANQGTTNGLGLSLGRDAASSGTLNIGSGGVVALQADSSAPGTAGETWNPFVRVGRDGNGVLNISGGGQLLLKGDAVSTVDFTRRTSLFIGGSGDTSIGGRGIASVSGAGSQIVVSGSDAYIGIGHGPLASGNVTVSNQGRLAATILGVGNYSGTGVLRLDNARVDLSGQFTGSGEFGAALVVGAQTGAVGNAQLLNGSVIRIENLAGTTTGGFAIGGSRTLNGGDGSVSLSGGSRIEVLMPAGVGGGTVGRTGSGLLRLSGGSSVDLGSTTFTVGTFAGSDGTVIATEGSTISAGWVGVGRRYDTAAGTSFDGGTGTMVLNGATLFAQDVVIGTNGFLGGSAGSIVVSGSVTNYGTFAPGSSPGTFTIEGSFVGGAGSRLVLEVQADGQGGFLTDLVQFGGSVDLGATAIEFRFLGDTNPNAFQDAGGFEIDTFLLQADGQGGYGGLDEALFEAVNFSASAEAYTIASFEFSAESGASFVATPVPEPGSWALLAAGLAAVAGLARRRRSEPE